jgi:hypothetical protein
VSGTHVPGKRASYQEAIDWIAYNDDTEWAEYEGDDSLGTLSVTAMLVADLFGKTWEQVRTDMRRALERKNS